MFYQKTFTASVPSSNCQPVRLSNAFTAGAVCKQAAKLFLRGYNGGQLSYITKVKNLPHNYISIIYLLQDSAIACERFLRISFSTNEDSQTEKSTVRCGSIGFKEKPSLRTVGRIASPPTSALNSEGSYVGTTTLQLLTLYAAYQRCGRMVCIWA